MRDSAWSNGRNAFASNWRISIISGAKAQPCPCRLPAPGFGAYGKLTPRVSRPLRSFRRAILRKYSAKLTPARGSRGPMAVENPFGGDGVGKNRAMKVFLGGKNGCDNMTPFPPAEIVKRRQAGGRVKTTVWHADDLTQSQPRRGSRRESSAGWSSYSRYWLWYLRLCLRRQGDSLLIAS